MAHESLNLPCTFSHRTHLDSLWVRVQLGEVRVRVHKTRVRDRSAWVRVHRGGVRVRVRVHKGRVRVRTRVRTLTRTHPLSPSPSPVSLQHCHQYFTSLMTNVLYFFMFWTFPPHLWSQNLGALDQWTVMLPENFHAFLPKMSILLISNTYTHFVQKSSYFISLMTKIIHFLMYWTLLHSIKIRIPWDIILIRQALPENHAFLPNGNFA